jgi:DNA modification methylase
MTKQVYDRDGITLLQGPFQASMFRPGQFDVLVLDPPSNITDSRIMHALFVKGRMIDSLKIPQIIYIFEGGSGWEFHRNGELVQGETFTDYLKPHPATHSRPVAVIKEILKLTKGSILDPFCGFGSTLIAAKQLGRAATGVEINPTRIAQIIKELNGTATTPAVS